MIDLHAHSTCSDGTLSPTALFQLGREVGLTALALTDHDTTAGLAEFLAAAADEPSLQAVPGVEISANVPAGTLHMLGYFIDIENAPLQETLRRIRGGRDERNQRMLNTLRGLGCEITWEDIHEFAGDAVVGRPHFAQALLKRGYVKTKNEAFDRYLAKGKPAYADRFRLSPEDSIQVILGAGGVPVLAHPFTLEQPGKALRRAVADLKAIGLVGLEGYYSEYSPAQQKEYLRLAKDLGLLVTGGSDFHGDINPAIRLGSGFGSLRIPDELMGPLREAAGNSS